MKALVYTGVETLEILDYPIPEPQADQQLVRIEASGICGSDMHAYLGHDERRPAPLILGHEVAGTIEGGPQHGQRVTVNPLVACGSCRACQRGHDNLCPERKIISMPPREGGFAQWVAMRSENLVPIPDHLSFDQAAMAEPLACGWHAVRLGLETPQLTGQSDLRVLVIGGGAIGLGAALSVRAQTHNTAQVDISEPNAQRRDYLATVWDGGLLAPDALPPVGDYDLVIDGVGFEGTRATASGQVRPGGVIAHIGLGSASGGLDIRRMTLQEISFIGTYTYTAQDFRDTVTAMGQGRLGALTWQEPRPLSDGAKAFEDIRAGLSAAPKIILKPWFN